MYIKRTFLIIYNNSIYILSNMRIYILYKNVKKSTCIVELKS